MRLTLAILAAGRAQRFGRSKALEPVGPSGETLFEYTVYDAIRAGCREVVFVTPPSGSEVLEAHAEAIISKAIPVRFVRQRLDDLPAGFRPPANREKPWGTGHAVLALRESMNEPFIVANADDFYGPRAIERLARRLKDGLLTGDPSHFLAGYELQDTHVPETRGVNRAMCQTDASMILEWLEEVYAIRRVGDEFEGYDATDEAKTLRGETLCSMNLWVFQPSIFDRLAAAFQRFHARLEDPNESEFLLSNTVSALVETGQARVRVVPTGESAVGLTHEQDVEQVESAVSLAVATGEYPTDLNAWFEGRSGRVPG